MRVEIGLLLIAFLVLLLLYVRRVILSKKVSQLIKEFARAFEEMKFEYQPTHLPKKMDDTFYALKKVESVFQSELSNLIRQNKIMLSIMSSVSEGIISIDEKLRVKFANASAIKLLKLDFPVKDRNLLELIRNPDVEQMVIQILHGISDYPEFIEWRFDDKIFKITSSPIKVGKTTTGAVVVISDITSVKKIEKTRRDFVANVSHEFKAPLSAIKVAVDTISQEKDENAIQKFLSIIRKSADYLTNMVDKLLELARLESGALKPEFCSTNISEIIIKRQI
jgi:two-component system phosphate regulon sensor histidine kinase PhoR